MKDAIRILREEARALAKQAKTLEPDTPSQYTAAFVLNAMALAKLEAADALEGVSA